MWCVVFCCVGCGVCLEWNILPGWLCVVFCFVNCGVCGVIVSNVRIVVWYAVLCSVCNVELCVELCVFGAGCCEWSVCVCCVVHCVLCVVLCCVGWGVMCVFRVYCECCVFSMLRLSVCASNVLRVMMRCVPCRSCVVWVV